MCSSRCPTPGAHKSWGECIRAKGIHIGDLKGHDVNKRGESDLAAYANAKAQGIQPSGIDRASVDRAIRISESNGTAFNANAPVAGLASLR